jgi:hypothetical protein
MGFSRRDVGVFRRAPGGRHALRTGDATAETPLYYPPII